METIQITVTHFYNHPILYPFMPQSIYISLEDAFLHDQEKALVPKWEYDIMIKQFMDSLKN